MVGMISHLIMDTLTKEGVPWLLPIPIKFGIPPLKRFRVTTGHLAEKIIFITLFVVDVWYIFANYSHLVNIFHHIS